MISTKGSTFIYSLSIVNASCRSFSSTTGGVYFYSPLSREQSSLFLMPWINCIWVDVAGQWVAPWLYNIGTTVLNGGVSMVVFFFVNKIIFPEGEAKQ